MWQGEPFETARPYFDAALATGKERALVRTFQLAAIRNRHNDAADAELIRVVDSMRRQNEMIDTRTARDAYTVYVREYGSRTRAGSGAEPGLPASELLATYLWLTHTPGVSTENPEVNDAVLAALNGMVQQPKR
jgi:hypothetical protein